MSLSPILALMPVWLRRQVSGRIRPVERFLALLAIIALVGCFSAGYLALRQFARAEDLHGVLSAAMMIAAGVTAHRILNSPGGER